MPSIHQNRRLGLAPASAPIAPPEDAGASPSLQDFDAAENAATARSNGRQWADRERRSQTRAPSESNETATIRVLVNHGAGTMTQP